MNLKSKLTGLITLAEEALKGDEPNMKKYDELLPQIEKMEAQIKAQTRIAGAKALATPTNGKQAVNPLSLSQDDPPESEEKEKKAHDARVRKSVQFLRYGDVDEHAEFITSEIYGENYRQLAAEQEVAFKAFLRIDSNRLPLDVAKILGRQLWHYDDVTDMLKAHLSVGEIKATMVEGTDVLGGYAVPPQISNRILRRIRGFTAVRGGGALIVQTSSSMIQWIKITGGGDQYPTAMRGAWGSEAVSLLEDAVNIVPVFTALVTDVLAIDEDEVFIKGTGAGEPRGILPAGSPDTGITTLSQAATGTAGEIEVDYVKNLRRQIASQYRMQGRASWIMASDTAGIIETFQDGIGRFYYQYLESGETFLRHRVRETESMPALASGSYSLLFGDLSGYAIVERLGLAVVRYNDSNTGINKVEFHIRRRIGGRVIEAWKLAALRASTS